MIFRSYSTSQFANFSMAHFLMIYMNLKAQYLKAIKLDQNQIKLIKSIDFFCFRYINSCSIYDYILHLYTKYKYIIYTSNYADILLAMNRFPHSHSLSSLLTFIFTLILHLPTSHPNQTASPLFLSFFFSLSLSLFPSFLNTLNISQSLLTFFHYLYFLDFQINTKLCI